MLECIGIPKILFKTNIKLLSIAQSNLFYRVRKVVRNKTKDTKLQKSKTKPVESKEYKRIRRAI